MNAPYLESDASLRQTVRIADTLNRHDLGAQIVENAYGEPLAVVARGALDLHKIQESDSLRQLKNRIEACEATDAESEEHLRVIDTLPVAGEYESLVLPASFLLIIDLAMQAAVERSDVLPTRLNCVQFEAPNRGSKSWLGMHLDYSIMYDQEIAARPVSGLNIQVTRGGGGTAIFGLIRTFTDIERIGLAESAGDEYQEDLLRELGVPFSDPVELGPGDAIIFQAAPHRRLGRLPVAHEFLTISDEVRYSELYSISDFAPAETVLRLRQRIARDYQLESLGYAA